MSEQNTPDWRTLPPGEQIIIAGRHIYTAPRDQSKPVQLVGFETSDAKYVAGAEGWVREDKS